MPGISDSSKKITMKHLLAVLLLAAMLLPADSRAGDYVIGEGDGLDILVWGVKELNVSVRVRPDGKITIPGLGDIKATGYTPQGLQKILAEKLKELVKNPNVTVTVRDITNSKVYVFGSGVKAGVHDLSRRTTLLQLLCTIGDLKGADLERAYILRNDRKIKTGFDTLFTGGNTAEDMAIESGDSIYIPALPRTDRNVYVLGAVNTPKFIEFREGMTVMEAVLEAGGFSRFARQNDTSIIRRDNGRDLVIPVKARDLWSDGDLAQNVRLKPSDYVIVRESLF